MHWLSHREAAIPLVVHAQGVELELTASMDRHCTENLQKMRELY